MYKRIITVDYIPEGLTPYRIVSSSYREVCEVNNEVSRFMYENSSARWGKSTDVHRECTIKPNMRDAYEKLPSGDRYEVYGSYKYFEPVYVTELLLTDIDAMILCIMSNAVGTKVVKKGTFIIYER